MKQNNIIEYENEQYAQLVSLHSDLPVLGSTKWIGKESEPLQGSLMFYNKNKIFKTHKHKLNPRIINRTEECFVVINGKIQIDIYAKEKLNSKTLIENLSVETFTEDGCIIKHLGTIIATSGDAIFIWRGFHKISILEDGTVCYEIKSGQFTSVNEDKEFMEEK